MCQVRRQNSISTHRVPSPAGRQLLADALVSRRNPRVPAMQRGAGKRFLPDRAELGGWGEKRNENGGGPPLPGCGPWAQERPSPCITTLDH